MENTAKNTWIKCIAVLLIIAVIAGGLLAVLNNVFHVSEEERLNRAVKSVYGKEVKTEKLDFNPDGFSSQYGKINSIYTFNDDGKTFFLFNSEGNGGYHNGSVTLWILIPFIGTELQNIYSVSLADSNKQTLMSKLTGEFYSAYQKIPVEDILSNNIISVKKEDKISNVVSGATYSSNAANNAVNTVFEYLRKVNVLEAE